MRLLTFDTLVPAAGADSAGPRRLTAITVGVSRIGRSPAPSSDPGSVPGGSRSVDGGGGHRLRTAAIAAGRKRNRRGGVSASRSAPSAPAIEAEKPGPYHPGFSLPVWPESLPSRFEVTTEGLASGDIGLRIAVIAEALADAGILQAEDVHGDSLIDTITKGLSRWLGTKELGDKSVRILCGLNLYWTDDITNGLELKSAFSDGTEDWWLHYGRCVIDTKNVPPIPAFAFRFNEGRHYILAVERWHAALGYHFGESVADAVIQVVNEGVSYIGGWNLDYFQGRVLDEFDEEASEEPDALTLDNFHKCVPQRLCTTHFDVARLRSAVRQIEINEGLSSKRKPPKLAVAVLRAALRLAEITYACEMTYRGLPDDIRRYCNTNHIGTFAHFLPPVAVVWSGIHGFDPCVRLLDFDAEMIQQDYYDNVCWLHGFDPDRKGDASVPQSPAFAVAKMVQMIDIVAALESLLCLMSQTPARTPKTHRPPRFGSDVDTETRVPMIEQFANGGGEATETATEGGISLCAL